MPRTNDNSMQHPLSTSAADLLEEGRLALLRGEWEAARSIAERGIAIKESAEGFEQLGMAAYWMNDAVVTIESRERAYLLYKAKKDRHSAARVAALVAIDYVEYRGEEASAQGWLQRARRMLEGLAPSAEHGWVMILEGHIALMADKNPEVARRIGAEATTLGRDLAAVEVEMMGLAIEGLARVSQGDVDAGMKLLDEAATVAVAGESNDLMAIGTACCYQIAACERVRDYERAGQWCDRVKEFCRRWRYGSLFATCRTQYGSILTWQGRWDEAEQELLAATRELNEWRPALANASTVRLGELRRRQGRFDEADELFDAVRTHPLTLLAQAALSIDRDDPAHAVEYAERYLRRFPIDNRTERVTGLEILVRANVLANDIDAARSHLDELRSIADNVPTSTLRGIARFAEGMVAVAEGALTEGRKSFEDAIDYFQGIDTPFECARAHLGLAETLAQLGRAKDAEREATIGVDIFQRLGAAFELQKGRAFIEGLATPSRPVDTQASTTLSRANDADLTRREIEILHLIAADRANDEIAEALFLSVRTVERHISNIYQKIGVSGRRARGRAVEYLRGNWKKGTEGI